MELKEEVVIVGGGIAGLATAIALKRVGIRSLVLERADNLRSTGAALTLSSNAWRALDALGVASKLTSVYEALQKGCITDLGDGKVREVHYVKPGSKSSKLTLRPVHRTALLEALAEEIPSEWIRFSSKLASIDQTLQEAEGGHVVTVRLEDGTTIKSKVVIGCDGVHSVVADWLGLAAPVYSGRCGIRGLSYHPNGHGLDHQVRQYIDSGSRRGGFASINDKEMYWFMVMATSSPLGRMSPQEIQKQVLEHYASNYPSVYKDVVEHAEPSSLSWAPLMFRYPWAILFGTLNRGGVTVAGDAMHPMTPDLGQGGCCALEDAVVLGRHIGTSYLKNGNKLVAGEVERVLGEYASERRWRVASMVAMSYISGWVQSGGGSSSNWFKKLVMNGIFYRYLATIFASVGSFDSGELPKPVSTKTD